MFNSSKIFQSLKSSSKLFLNGARRYSSHSISSEQTKQVLPQPIESKSNFHLGKVILLGIFGKFVYDTTNSAMAFYKGNKETEAILSETWNEAIFPVFEFVKNNKEIKKELGDNITLGAPPVHSTSPITETKRDFKLGVFTPVSPKVEDQWYLQTVQGIATSTKGINSSATPSVSNNKKKVILDNSDTGNIISQMNQLNIDTTELPILIPYSDKFLFALPYGEVVSNLSIPIKGKNGEGALLVTLYANDDKWKIRNIDVFYKSNGKLKQIIEPNIRSSKNK